MRSCHYTLKNLTVDLLSWQMHVYTCTCIYSRQQKSRIRTVITWRVPEMLSNDDVKTINNVAMQHHDRPFKRTCEE